MGIIKNIDKALARMVKRGHKNTTYYYRLLAKRNAITNGAKYKIVDVSEEVIKAVGSLMPRVNQNFKEEFIKPRKGTLKIFGRGKEMIGVIENAIKEGGIEWI